MMNENQKLDVASLSDDDLESVSGGVGLEINIAGIIDNDGVSHSLSEYNTQIDTSKLAQPYDTQNVQPVSTPTLTASELAKYLPPSNSDTSSDQFTLKIGDC